MRSTLSKLAIGAAFVWAGAITGACCRAHPAHVAREVPPADARLVCVMQHERGCSWLVAAQPGETDEQVRARVQASMVQP